MELPLVGWLKCYWIEFNGRLFQSDAILSKNNSGSPSSKIMDLTLEVYVWIAFSQILPPRLLYSRLRLVIINVDYSYDEISDDERGQEDGHAQLVGGSHALPQGLNPLATQHAEYHHEGVVEILEMPPAHTHNIIMKAC